MEQRLIDVNAYLKKVCTYKETGCGSCKLQTACPVNEPTVEAEPVRHGRWIPREDGDVCPFWERYTCSECGENSDDTRYCSYCGARMIEE